MEEAAPGKAPQLLRHGHRRGRRYEGLSEAPSSLSAPTYQSPSTQAATNGARAPNGDDHAKVALRLAAHGRSGAGSDDIFRPGHPYMRRSFTHRRQQKRRRSGTGCRALSASRNSTWPASARRSALTWGRALSASPFTRRSRGHSPAALVSCLLCVRGCVDAGWPSTSRAAAAQYDCVANVRMVNNRVAQFVVRLWLTLCLP